MFERIKHHSSADIIPNFIFIFPWQLFLLIMPFESSSVYAMGPLVECVFFKPIDGSLILNGSRLE